MKQIDENINNIRFRASSRFLQNSTCLFIEYIDAIQLPWFSFLSFFRSNEKVNDLFDMEKIRYLSPQALLVDYFAREYRNPLVGLLKDNSIIPFEQLDILLDNLVNTMDIFFSPQVDTNLTPMVNNLLINQLIQDLIIYYPTDNKFVLDDINHKFNGKAKLVTGDLKSVLKDIPQDTTYIFSDVNNVLLLEELNKLNFSAIMLPMDYRYNFTDDKKTSLNINMEYLQSKYVFKWSMFRVA